MRARTKATFFALLTAAPTMSTRALAQDLPALRADERAALETITKGKILATVRFLASDELRGRDTGSAEYMIASAYVAARFAGAGLKGLGKDGSFYLYAPARKAPKSGAEILDAEGAPRGRAALLACGDAALDVSVKASSCAAGLQSADYPDAFRGAAIVDEAPAREMRGLSGVESQLFGTARQMRVAKRAGARALLIRAKTKGALRKAVTSGAAANSRFASSFTNLGIPTLLVDEDFAPGQYAIRVPAWELGPSKNRNVCAVLRGRDPELAKEAILITAHLDHVGIGGRGEDRIRNGADDNATGSCAVLALAEAYAALPQAPKRSVIFMCFWGEEKGLLGSREFARKPAWPLEKILANINIEMIGRPDDKTRDKSWVTGWTKSDLGPLMARGAKRVGVEIFRHKRFSAMLYQRSDNWSLAQKGVIAHSFSSSTLHKDYHGVGDEWQKLEIPNMLRVTRGLFAGSLPLAEGTLTPKSR